MPEGHTLFRVAAELREAFGGLPTRVSSPQGRFAADAAALDGAVLVGAESAGKHLFVEFDGARLVHVHLGLIGRLDVVTGAAEVRPPTGQVRMRLEARRADGTAYADLRGAITCRLVTPARRGPGGPTSRCQPRSLALPVLPALRVLPVLPVRPVLRCRPSLPARRRRPSAPGRPAIPVHPAGPAAPGRREDRARSP